MNRDNHQRQALALVKLSHIGKYNLPLLNLKNAVRATWDTYPLFIMQLQTAIKEVLDEDIRTKGDQSA